MSEPEPPRHPGRGRGLHAAPPSPLRLLVRSLFAVAIVALGVAVLVEWRGSPTTSSLEPSGGPAITSPLPVGTPSASATPGPRLTSPPPVAASPSPPARVVAPLFVANDTREQGKARRAAAKFRAGGWPISGTGNYRGRRLSETTVYYSPGNVREQAAAQSLRRQYPSVKKVAPRFAGLPGKGLVVVLTAAFPD